MSYNIPPYTCPQIDNVLSMAKDAVDTLEGIDYDDAADIVDCVKGAISSMCIEAEMEELRGANSDLRNAAENYEAEYLDEITAREAVEEERDDAHKELYQADLKSSGLADELNSLESEYNKTIDEKMELQNELDRIRTTRTYKLLAWIGKRRTSADKAIKKIAANHRFIQTIKRHRGVQLPNPVVR